MKSPQLLPPAQDQPTGQAIPAGSTNQTQEHKDGKEVCAKVLGEMGGSIGPRYIVYMYEIVKG